VKSGSYRFEMRMFEAHATLRCALISRSAGGRNYFSLAFE